MDKLIGKTVEKVTKAGEKLSPLKSVKLKVDFQKQKMAKKLSK